MQYIGYIYIIYIYIYITYNGRYMNLTQVSSLVCVCVSMYVFQPKDQHLNYLETLEHLLRK